MRDWHCLALEIGGMTVAELRDRMGVDEFHDWQLFFAYRRELEAVGPDAVRAADRDDRGATDHGGIAKGMHSMFATMAKDFGG